MDPTQKAKLKPAFNPSWWLPIGGVVLILVSMGVAWRSTPDPMAVQWSTDGGVTNTMPKAWWAVLWAGAWVVVSGGLVALRAPLDWRRGLLIMVLGILVSAYAMTLINNLGAATWQQARSLSLVWGAVWAVFAAGGIWLVDRLLER